MACGRFKYCFNIYYNMQHSGSVPAQKIIAEAMLSRVSDPKKLMRKIRKEFSHDKDLFEKMSADVTPTHPHSIRAYDPQGANVVVKHCGTYKLRGGMVERTPGHHGADTEMYSVFTRLYGAMRAESEIEPIRYHLVPIRHFGIVEVEKKGGVQEVYLVMERLAENPARFDVKEPMKKSIAVAETELAVHSRLVLEKGAQFGLTLEIPQVDSPIILGNTMPSAFEKGTWIFALPRDFL